LINENNLKNIESIEDFNLKVGGYISRFYPTNLTANEKNSLVENLRHSWRDVQFENWFGLSKVWGVDRGLSKFIETFYGSQLADSDKQSIGEKLWDKWRKPKKDNLMKISSEVEFQNFVETYIKESYINLSDDDKSKLKDELMEGWKSHENKNSPTFPAFLA
jgi:hypothetical protein